MGNFFIALLAAVGSGGWVFSKFQRSSGGNTKRSLMGAVITGTVILIFVWTLFNTVLH